MEIEVFEIDRISTDLAKTVLRRRDLYLKALKPKLCPELLMPLSSSDFLWDNLFSGLTPELIKRHKEIRDQQQLLDAISGKTRSSSAHQAPKLKTTSTPAHPQQPQQAPQPQRSDNKTRGPRARAL